MLSVSHQYNKRVSGADAPLLLAIDTSSVKCVKLLVEVSSFSLRYLRQFWFNAAFFHTKVGLAFFYGVYYVSCLSETL